jgi:acetyltransferase-like isoleucine patch superfamily enzyme
MLIYDNEKFFFIGENVNIGNGVVIEPLAILGIDDRFHPPGELNIGHNAFIGTRCTIYSGVKVGDDFDISDQTTIFTDNKIGNNVRIGPKTVIKNGCIIGDNVRINSQVFLERVIIKNNVFIGPNTVFTDDLHPPCPKYKECVAKTIVESFVSIGASVFIAPGLKIGSRSQIYGGSVILHDVPPGSVVAGNPGKVIKSFDSLECKPKLFNKPFEWWGEDNEK